MNYKTLAMYLRLQQVYQKIESCIWNEQDLLQIGKSI